MKPCVASGSPRAELRDAEHTECIDRFPGRNVSTSSLMKTSGGSPSGPGARGIHQCVMVGQCHQVHTPGLGASITSTGDE